MVPAPLCCISVTPSTTHNQIGPLWCWFPSGWACACSRPLWVSPRTSPVRLGVCPAASTPMGVFNQRFEALFPCAGALGGALGVHRGGVMLYIREGPRGSNGSCSSLSDFSHALRYPQSNWAPLVLIPEWVGLCTFSAPVGVSPTNCPVRLGVSPAAVSTPMGVFNQRFEALFPCAGALGCVVCFAPRCSSWFIHVQMWGRGVCQPPPCGVC